MTEENKKTDKKQAILALDIGTTSTRSIIFNADAKILYQSDEAFPLSYPENGWVEQSADDLLQKTIAVAKDAVEYAADNDIELLSIGITNQRETTIVWDKDSGEAVYPAIVWQDRRTGKFCRELAEQVDEERIQKKTGLIVDAYFSASKVHWILENAEIKDKDNLLFGTVDSFIIWHLTGRKHHVTDATNASRTLLYNIRDNCWDSEMLEIFNVPEFMLPEVKNSSDFFGDAEAELIGASLPIHGVAGDQQAAAIGQACLKPGMIKSTYGTGCFVLMNTGDEIIQSKNKMLSTIAYRIDDKTCYALEGSIFNAGTAIQWLRDNLKLIKASQDTEALAESLENNDKVYMVPAFTGMGAPYWDSDARGAIYGLTRDTQIAHIARAALESVCYQTHDLLAAMAEDSGIEIIALRVDGGMAENKWLLQLLSDIINVEVQRPHTVQTTALGAAFLAGLKSGIYSSLDAIADCWQEDVKKTPGMDKEIRDRMVSGWHRAVKRTLTENN